MSTSSIRPFDRFVADLAGGLDLDSRALSEDATLEEDLGLDSLDLLEILARVEELGVRLPDEVVMELHTVGDLYREYVLRAGQPA